MLTRDNIALGAAYKANAFEPFNAAYTSQQMIEGVA